MSDSHILDPIGELDIAIIGMAGRFPGAQNLDEFWRNLRDGVESISFFLDQELRSAGVDGGLLSDPNYVKAGGVLEDTEMFDAAFFGYSPREAEIMDPQQRLFLECAWEALENAGYMSESYDGLIGVYAGAGMNTYLLSNLLSDQRVVSRLEPHQIKIANDNSYLATRVSYKLNLEGPSVSLQTACSTSLVAVHLACQNLLNYQCDMALAGGVAVNTFFDKGYLFQEGGIFSPDGHCRAFDAKAQGTVSGNGVGIIVLKRMADALADGDNILAVIKGSAINNDGSLKVGFTAPREEGQAKVIATALAMAGIEADAISYVEAHGTGTSLGDPIEIAALARVFKASLDRKAYCALGSVKTNVGHLDAAAGIAGLIKTVLALMHKMIPPTLHLERPNPALDLSNTPFYINNKQLVWNSNGRPRLAGVSSFGIGGANSHIIVQEAPIREESGLSRPWQLLALSAKSASALERATDHVVDHLRQHPDQKLADIAYTLQVGRRRFDHRRVLVCRDREDAVKTLEARDVTRIVTAFQEASKRSVAFMFSGLGDHYLNMGWGLYRHEPSFRQQVDLCCEILKPNLKLDLRDVLYPAWRNADEPSQSQVEHPGLQRLDLREMLGRRESDAGEAGRRLSKTFLSQPALFVVEYSLAKLLMEWGIKPEAMIGYSIGEYVAACLAGVFTLEDALYLVARRGEMIEELPEGAMLAVALPEQATEELLEDGLSLSAINGPSMSVVSGPPGTVERLESALSARGVVYRRLRTSHAFHSRMMEPVVERFIELVNSVTLRAPQIPYLSNVTGNWIKAEEATEPGYWARHMCRTVRFADGLNKLIKQESQALLEIGPGQSLCSLALQHPSAQKDSELVALPTMRGAYDRQADESLILIALGKLWLAGVSVDWRGVGSRERRHRVGLPTYPFERQRYWIEAQKELGQDSRPAGSINKKNNLSEWCYAPSWKRALPPIGRKQGLRIGEQGAWLLFADRVGVGMQVAKRLEQEGERVILVKPGRHFDGQPDAGYNIDPGERTSYDRLLRELAEAGGIPKNILHLWSVTDGGPVAADQEGFERAQAIGLYSLLTLTQALAGQIATESIQICVVTNGVQDVTGTERLLPEKATIIGACKVIGQEYPNLSCRCIDIELTDSVDGSAAEVVELLFKEVMSGDSESVIAYRGRTRWAQIYDPVRLECNGQQAMRLRSEGVYIITGGLGEVGLALAEQLAESVKARLVLVGRTGLPPRDERARYLAAHDESDPVCKRIRRIQMIEELGSEVVVMRADVADEAQMYDVINRTIELFAGIHGVIHAAGIVGEKAHRAISETGQIECGWHFHPKVYGLYALEKVLRGINLDFCLMTSSLSPILGGLGFTAYASANQFMDTFAQKQNRTGAVNWTSVNWEGWTFQDKRAPVTGFGAGVASLTITSDEGKEVFMRLMSSPPISQLVVSTGDLAERLDQWTRPGLRPGDARSNGRAPAPLYSRPNLRNPYIPPGSDLEKKIADIWRELLGVKQVGVHDSFFELGGNSLVGLQFVHQLRNQLNVTVPVTILYEGPTVNALAKLICEEANQKQVLEPRAIRGERRRQAGKIRRQH